MADGDLDSAIGLRAEGDLTGAIKMFGAVIDEDGPDQGEAWFWLATSWWESGDAATAVDCYRAAIETGLGDEMHVQAHLWLADALLAEHRAEVAVETLDAVWSLVDEDTDAGSTWQRLYARARRATWRLTLAPGRYVTRSELFTAAIAVVCALSSLLPWAAQTRTVDGKPELLTLWQFSWLNALPVSVAALITVSYLIQLYNRETFSRPCALVNLVLAVIATVGATRATIGLVVFTAISQRSGTPWTTMHLGAVVGWLLAATLLATTALLLRRVHLASRAKAAAAGGRAARSTKQSAAQ